MDFDRRADRDYGVQLLDIIIGEGDASGGVGAAGAVAVDEDFAAEGGIPEVFLIFGEGEVGGEGGCDLVMLGLGDVALGEAAVGIFFVGVIETEGEVEVGFGVFVDDAIGAFGGAAVAFFLFVAGVGAGDAGVSFDEVGAVEEFEGIGRCFDDEVGGLELHADHRGFVVMGETSINSDADHFADGVADFGALPVGRLGSEGEGVEAGLVEAEHRAVEVKIG